MHCNPLLLAALALSALACGTKPPAQLPPQAVAATAPSTITGRDWVLVALGEQTSPMGSKAQPPALRFETADFRAAGFAGCNRYFATYALRGDSLTFGPVASTKMFCAESNDLERTFLATLAATTTYQLSDSILTLRTRDGLQARFRAAK